MDKLSSTNTSPGYPEAFPNIWTMFEMQLPLYGDFLNYLRCRYIWQDQYQCLSPNCLWEGGNEHGSSSGEVFAHTTVRWGIPGCNPAMKELQHISKAEWWAIWRATCSIWWSHESEEGFRPRNWRKAVKINQQYSFWQNMLAKYF